MGRHNQRQTTQLTHGACNDCDSADGAKERVFVCSTLSNGIPLAPWITTKTCTLKSKTEGQGGVPKLGKWKKMRITLITMTTLTRA